MEFAQELLRPFVRKLGGVREGLGAERVLNSQEVGMPQPVPACHDSSPQMRPAWLQLWTEPLHSPTPMP